MWLKVNSYYNYQEALAILKKRFGNQQPIIGKHNMDIYTLINLDAISSNHNIKGLCNFTQTNYLSIP